MSESRKVLESKANKLRRQLAEHQAKADACRYTLAQIDAKLDNRPIPLSGLDQLWKLAPDKARERSSKHLCRVEWNKVHPADRPTVTTLLDAMAGWRACDEWRKDGGQYVPALDRWIKERRWEGAPSITASPSRARSIAKSIPTTAQEDIATPEDILAAIAQTFPKRMPS